jgi:hypothetical protein
MLEKQDFVTSEASSLDSLFVASLAPSFQHPDGDLMRRRNIAPAETLG